jgi:uncharacterized protein YndB with AHSA1/START domain
MSETPVGKTKTQGWEMGIRRTFPIAPDEAWKLLMTSPGLELWLGEGVTPPFKKGDTYQTTTKTSGEVRSVQEGSLLRMTWQPQGWDSASTLQLRVMQAKNGATISIHHEKLQNGDQREEMLAHWSGVLDGIGDLIKPDE